MHAGKGNHIQIHSVGLPTLSEIVKTLEVCQKNPGKIVILQWTAEGTDKEYELSAIIPVVRTRVGATPMPISSTPELSLVYRILPNSNQTLVWNQVSADPKAIFHLVSRELGGPKNVFRAFDDEDNVSSNDVQTVEIKRRPTAPQQDVSQTIGVAMKLEGTLGEIDLSNLLQSISLCKMTGCMKVFNDDVAASLFMDKGNPTHAYVIGSRAITESGAEIDGGDALLEMLLMNEGTFQFNPQQLAIERTVPKPLQMYLLEGAALRDHFAQLTDQGFTEETVFSRAHKNLEYAAFKAKLAEGIPASLQIQKHFYQLIDGKTAFSEMIRKQPLKRSEWVPALFNLLHTGLIVIKNSEADQQLQHLTPEALTKSLQLAQELLIHKPTGILPFPIFLHQIDQEISRYAVQPLPFTLAAFEVWLQTSAGAQLLTDEEIKLMASRVRPIISHHDQLGFFMDGFFGLLMPMQDSSAACGTLQRLLDTVTKTPFPRAKDSSSVKIIIGLSSVPEFTGDLVGLLTTTNDAKNFCKKTGANIYTYKNLSAVRN